MATVTSAKRRALVVFPAIAMVVSVGCVSMTRADSSVAPAAKKTTTTVKRKPSSTTVPPKGSAPRSALGVLATIARVKERPQGYSRDLFRHWTDDDGDGCNTREEVLVAESLSPAQVDAYGCKVIEGDWYSEYDGVTHTDPSGLDIDHVVALKEAWDSGAWAWSAAQRQKFANDLSDPRSLIAVTAGVNRSKSDKDPSNWIPPRQGAVCTYVAQWVAIKARWKLSMDESEWGRVRNILTKNCPTATVAPWGSALAAVAPVTGSVAPPAPSSSVVTSSSTSSGVRQVSPVRCKAAEFGQTGEYKGVPYVCTNRKDDGSMYAPGYYFWRPAR